MLTNEGSDKLLKDALDLAPNDPRMLYWVAQTKVQAKPLAKGADYDPTVITMDYSQALPLIERAIKADPKFLPGYYARAMMQPTAEQRIAELQKVAAVDPDNAEPYFLMAIDTWKQISAGKKFAAGSNNAAHDVSASDWQKVSELLDKVNASKVFSWRQCATPSVSDISVTINGKKCPAKAVESMIATMMDLGGLTQIDGGQYAPGAVSSSTVLMMASQAAWAAQLAAKAGNQDQAIKYLDTTRAFAAKYASHEPYMLIPFLRGFVVRTIAADTEAKILKDAGDEARLRTLDDETAKWKDANALCDDILKQATVTVNDVMLSPAEKLTYTDYEAERNGVKTVLTKAGIIQ